MHPLMLLGAGVTSAWAVYKLFFEEEELAKVFISFDFDHDRNYAYLVKAMASNPAFESIRFRDGTPVEIKSSDIGRVKAALTTKINQATHTLVVVGKHANARHPDGHKIGSTNWQNWEVEQSIKAGNKLVMVKLDNSYSAPNAAYGQNASWARSYTVESIAAALRG